MISDTCLLCGTPLQLTPSWRTLFTRFQQVVCKRCESKFERIQQKNITTEVGEKVHALFYYNDAMKDFLHRYKFLHDILLANVFREQLYTALRDTTVVPIPMHPQKLTERSFHHVEYLLQCANVRYERLLRKTSIETQATKTKEQRLQTPQIFELEQKPSKKSYTIFDDIVTTGVTLKHAKKLLLEHGALDVRCVTLIKA